MVAAVHANASLPCASSGGNVHGRCVGLRMIWFCACLCSMRFSLKAGGAASYIDAFVCAAMKVFSNTCCVAMSAFTSVHLARPALTRCNEQVYLT